MSYPSKPKPVSYTEVVRAFSGQDVQDDINDACGKLAHAMTAMMEKFDAITKQMHTIDLLRLSAPLVPKWDSMRQDLAELLWQFRTNSGVISGRLKLFCTAVLPMAARNLDAKSARSPSHNESLQVLQSYMSISAEHAALTRTLTDRVFRLSARMVVFVTEFTKLVGRHAVSGQQEMWDLSQRLSELDNQVQHLFTTTSELSITDITHLLFTSSRMISSAGRTGRSKITRKQIVLDGDLINIGKAYESADRKRNEVAHAQYAAQLRQSRTDPLAVAQTMVSSFLLDQMLTSESGLSFFLSIWSRLRTDCTEIFQWTKNPGQFAVPPIISCYAESGSTLYAALATALDVYCSGIDPSLRMGDHRDAR
ncbi:hypothetical protein GALMADRAFT_139308 [Galerina marginata CBS 339.88]|uniref:Uncharacterized protein n=1 Tax=Galerina marginata (strain CBS 339.88) TaxID=685588 RepID=A0A067T2A0_GALM3|nr:hypothetical protein GALMADRAFT_139308 [Galerina marginata CBS 339.88]